jgi:ATP-dependent DNA helicase RecG
MLAMTATPIPRTLTLSFYGDLDVSILDELPAGRGKLITGIRLTTQTNQAATFVTEQLSAGRQAYVVYPLIEESDKLATGAATAAYAEWAEKLADFRVGLVHGRMGSDEKDAVMREFRNGKIDVLVATTVIEVGVDVPNANVMLIYHAERFGLAQLHQLRGRVGRGTRRSLCVFVGDPATEDASKRLEAIGRTDDGFEIAELDLSIRGPGELFGSRQSGLPPFRVADLEHDMELLRLARRDAKAMVDRDPGLDAPEHALLRRKILRTYGDALGLADVA